MEMVDQVEQEVRVVRVVLEVLGDQELLLVLDLQRPLGVLGIRDGQQLRRLEVEQVVPGAIRQGWAD